jgi:hypothetical protein
VFIHTVITRTIYQKIYIYIQFRASNCCLGGKNRPAKSCYFGSLCHNYEMILACSCDDYIYTFLCVVHECCEYISCDYCIGMMLTFFFFFCHDSDQLQIIGMGTDIC